ncbi:MAG TPA: protoporphyrinogen oxidase [Ilumatobacteraceae bacterium]
MTPGGDRAVIVVGAGITGLTAAFRLRQLLPDAAITVLESDDHVGGKIRSSRFAGVDGIDEGADAFLTRVPHAMQLVGELGLTDTLTSPAVASANVWWNGMHEIPEGLLLGVPTDLAKLARSHLLTWPGKLRAGLEPILPGTGVSTDSVGLLIRKRFGRQVHERLVDPLVGSIYAADTDRFSLAGVPQILDLASHNRSLLIGGRKMRAKAPPSTGPIFATPTAGMAALTDALAASLRASGVAISTGRTVNAIERSAAGWLVDSELADAIILATPARATAPLLAPLSPEASASLAGFVHAPVVMMTLAVRAADWPERLHARSGYLVPKPVQKWVTAASFGSSKWKHWQGRDEAGNDEVILRISLGRDGRDLLDQTDDALLAAAVGEVGGHLGLDLQPTSHRITRWPMAFPQYRPGHAARIDAIEKAVATDAPGVFLCGASYRGIGIPACIQQANATAARVAEAIRG